MPEPITSYRTADGATFDTESQALAHEAQLEEQARVDAILPPLDDDASRGQRTQRSRERETVLRFLAKERATKALEGAQT